MVRNVTLFVVAALTTACATSGATHRPVPEPFPKPDAATRSSFPTPPPTGAADGYAIAGPALSLRGVPYRNGGSDPSGFDCSGFVWFVFGQHGIPLPRAVADQSRAGQSVAPDALDAGDLLFFSTKGAGATHVGIAIGGEEFVHAPSSNGQVRVERLGTTYWSSRFVGARRVATTN
jgi:cell wall-associated NlpC family hydrolase